ncbi:MAG TPA: oligosaccharide flippase family protein [Oligoflexia bacterium]|nr:oligosaccharide flippase family protein [Oligoflexia bacterium]
MTPELSSRLPSLRWNFTWTFAGNAFYNGCQWLMVVLIAKLRTPEDVGRFVMAFAVSAPIFMFANLNLRAVQATDAAGEFSFNTYGSLRLVTTAAALAVVCTVAACGPFDPEITVLILIVGLAKGIECLSDIVFGRLQFGELMDLIAKSMIFKGASSLAAIAAILYFTGSLPLAAGGMAASWLAVFCLYDLKNLHRAAGEQVRPSFDRAVLTRLFVVALPLGAVMMLISLNTNIPRYFVERQLGIRQLGLYGAMAYIIVAGAAIVMALGQSAAPRLAKYYAAQDYCAFRQLVRKLLVLGTAIGCGMLLAALVAGRQILHLLYGPEYAAYNKVFVLLMAAAPFLYAASLFGYAVTAARRFVAQLPVLVTVNLVNVAVCYFSLDLFGLRAVPIALLLGALTQLAGFSCIIRRALEGAA